MEQVILVTPDDNAIGTMEKMEAHVKGVLHRAFSVLLYNSKGEMLLQKRAKSKYHSAGLWTNACCSHPLPGESVEVAARRRLREEMGIDVHSAVAYNFIYKASLDNNLTEHELDHVLIGNFGSSSSLNIPKQYLHKHHGKSRNSVVDRSTTLFWFPTRFAS
jgi:isopentenyl-diphosphate delta-isomerase